MGHHVEWHGISWNLKRCSTIRVKNIVPEQNERKPVLSVEIKYCVRCGALIGMAAKNRKYCDACRKGVIKENKRRYDNKQKEGVKTVPCAFCGRPMLRRFTNQKYHKACAYPAQIKKMRALNVVYSSVKRERRMEEKKRQEEKRRVPTIQEIEAKAKELGTTYGKVVLRIQNGTIHME